MNEAIEQLIKRPETTVVIASFPFGRFDNYAIDFLINDISTQSLSQMARDLILPFGKIEAKIEQQTLIQDLISHYERSLSTLPALELICEGGEEQIVDEVNKLVYGICCLIYENQPRTLYAQRLTYIELENPDTVFLVYSRDETGGGLAMIQLDISTKLEEIKRWKSFLKVKS